MLVRSLRCWVVVALCGVVAAETDQHLFLQLLRDWAAQDPHECRSYFASSTPAGGYLYRFEFDLTGDGKDELFVSSSLSGDGQRWYVYRQIESESYEKIGDVGLPISGFYIRRDPESHLASLFSFLPIDLRSALIVEQSCCVSGFTEVKRSVLTGQQLETLYDPAVSFVEAAKSLGFDVGEKVSPRVSKILLGKLVTGTGTWRPYATRLSPVEQYLDKADAKDIASVKSLPLRQLLQAIGIEDTE